MRWLRRRKVRRLPECAFVANGLQCMRREHVDGPHAQISPLPILVWDGSRWTLPR